MANWKNRFTIKSKVFVEREIDGQKFRFYPNRIGLLEELAEVTKPIGMALAAFMDQDETRNVTTESFKDKVRTNLKTNEETADSAVNRTVVAAPSPEVSAHRRKQRESVVDSLFGAVASVRNRVLLGRLLMDSLREDFPYKKEGYSPAEIEEFLYGDGEGYEGLQLPTLVQLCQGWIAANGKVFGDMGERVAGLVKGRLAQLQKLQTTEEQAADGADSTIPSSEPSATDSSLISSSLST